MSTIVTNADGKEIDFRPFHEGITVLKFGRRGAPKERLIKLIGNRYLTWTSSVMSPKFGRQSEIDLQYTVPQDSLRKGQTTVQFARHEKNFGEPQIVKKSLSLMYVKDGVKCSLNIAAAHQQVFKYVYDVLKHIINEAAVRRKTMSVERLFFKAKFEEADTDRSLLVSKKEIFKLIPTMNINMSKHDIRSKFSEKDVDGNGELDFNEFSQFMESLRRRVDLEALWSTAVSGEPCKMRPLDLPGTSPPAALQETMREDKFLEFWNATQRERMPELEMKKKLMAAIKGEVVTDTEVKASLDSLTVTYNTFRNIMTSCANEAYDEKKVEGEEDMTLPLSDYFIASSHNTYLEGNQIWSKSSVGRYVHDLSIGCRCVELDCWDGDNGEPVIYHGYTATSKIKFKDVILAIKRSAFANSPYPVILSLENHCEYDQQNVMAAILREILGDMIQKPPANRMEILPSPAQLMRKIIIKGKSQNVPAPQQEADDEEMELDDWGVHGHKMSRDAKNSDARSEPRTAKKAEDKGNKIHPALAALTFLVGSKQPFDGEPSEKGPSAKSQQIQVPVNHTNSYKEDKTIKYARSKDTVDAWRTHNMTHVSRIYPCGKRTDSSNYDPTIGWLAGAQLVALNYQTGDIFMQLNTGRFRANRSQGYVMKPMRMLSPIGKKIMAENGLKQRKKKPTWGDIFWGPACANHYPVKITVHVISGQSLPKPLGSTRGEVIDPYVELITNGEEIDRKKESTKVITDNGFNPLWNEIFVIEVQRPDIAMLTFRCMDSDLDADDFIASSSIPVYMLRQGFRTVQLYDQYGGSEGNFAFAALFVHINVEPASRK